MTKTKDEIAETVPGKSTLSAGKQSASVDRSGPPPAVTPLQGYSWHYKIVPGTTRPTKFLKRDLPYSSQLKVKEEFTQTAQDIYSLHGDIVANSLFEGTLRADMLQSTCAIYEKLKKSKFSVITLAELESTRRDVSDLERAHLEVSWLAKRLDDIYDAKQCVEHSSLMDEEKERNQQSIETLEKSLSSQQEDIPAIRKKLEAEKAKTATILQTFLEDKEKALHFSWKSSEGGSCSGLNNTTTAAGYKVKEEFESAAHDIFSHQGDIVANCLFQGSLRVHLLESACVIYQTVEKLSLKDITLAELEAIRRDVHDLEKAAVDVSWVAKGIDDMYETKKSAESPSFMAELHNQNRKNIQELEKELELAEGRVQDTKVKLEAEKAHTETLRQNFLNAKEKVSRFFRKSLVDGI
uniref:Uncharacterized protein n=1 Tax=Kalanchoe fedtschenkoi TaxID=63787 RepID=A0A7N0VM97_KALFE